MAQNYKILSVGGSIIIPKEGFDISFLKKFKSLILEQVKKGEKFILVIGGGGTCRQYQQTAAKVTNLTKVDLDMIGIETTKLNAHFVRFLFKEHAHKDIILNPSKRLASKKPILVAAGWKPGHSTDTDAVLLAKTYGAKHILNLSNISYVYDKDPNIYKDAKKIERIDWTRFRKEIVGNSWEPGRNVPFDPFASKTAQNLGLTVSILDGTNMKELKKALQGKTFKGTQIYP